MSKRRLRTICRKQYFDFTFNNMARHDSTHDMTHETRVMTLISLMIDDATHDTRNTEAGRTSEWGREKRVVGGGDTLAKRATCGPV